MHTEVTAALADVEARGAPIVVKADGLAAGKGVVVAMTVDEARAAVRDMLAGNSLGAAGRRVVIEDFLDGEEASFIIMAAGGHALEMATSQDHKRVGDGDTGPNTGGMGAYSPAPVVTAAVRERVMREVIQPTLDGLRQDGIGFTGFLYAGLMIGTGGAPRVLEFNCRLGDPETQPLMMRLKSDLVDLVEAALDARLDRTRAEWDPRPALGVVMAAAGYPGSYRKGDEIRGLADAAGADLKVFLTASPEERARRRAMELDEREEGFPYEIVLEQIKARDRQDTERKVAPLRPADDAVLVDSSMLTEAEVIAHIVGLIDDVRRRA